MCCAYCPKYEGCQEKDRLEGDCCPECPDYYECTDMDDEFGNDGFEDDGFEDDGTVGVEGYH